MKDRTRSSVKASAPTQSTDNPSRVLAAFPAGHPRGQYPAQERADEYIESGTPATVVMDIRTDEYLVVRWAA